MRKLLASLLGFSPGVVYMGLLLLWKSTELCTYTVCIASMHLFCTTVKSKFKKSVIVLLVDISYA